MKKSSINKVEVIETDKKLCNIKFTEYLGQTVTVYVNAGGMVGNGFTGVLIGYENTYIRILVSPSAAPACSMGNSCNGRTANPLFCVFCPYAQNNPLGTMVEIPVNAIVAFVHNVLSSHHYEF